MNAVAIDYITEHYVALSSLVPMRPIRNEAEYERAVSVLGDLLDAGGAKQGTTLAELVETVGSFIEAYDEAHYRLPEVTGLDAVKFFMQQHGLTQGDVPEIGSQGVVSEILNGKRDLNIRQIKALSDRFGVDPSVFM
ncbi:MAG: helix-turn-helix domain-containing protein [Pseudoxanthomonas sp.]